MLPAILAAARVIGSGAARVGGAAVTRAAPIVSRGATAAAEGVSKLRSSGAFGKVAEKLKRDAPGEIWRRAGGDQVPVLDKMFNHYNDKRVGRIDRYNEIKEIRAARKNRPQGETTPKQQKSDQEKFKREQKQDQTKQNKRQEQMAQKEEAASKAQAHATANHQAVQASQGDKGNSFLERISNDIAQLKDYIFKNGIGGENNPLKKQTPTAGGGGGLLSGILSSLALGIPAIGGSVMGSLGRGVDAIKGIGGKAIDLVKSGGSKVVDVAKSVAPRIGSLAESAGGAISNAASGLRAGAANVISKGSGMLSSAGEAAAGLFKGGGAVGRIAGTVGRVAGPAAAVAGAGLTGYEVGSWLNKKMEGTDIGKAKDSVLNSIFAGVDKMTGGAISGDSKVADAQWKESSLGKFVGGAKEKAATAADKALSAIIPSAQAAEKPAVQVIPIAGAGTIAQPGQVAIPSAFAPDNRGDEIRLKADQQKFQRQQQLQFEQSQRTNQDLLAAVGKNTEATIRTVEPLKKISSPDWLESLGGWISGVARKVGGWVSNKASAAGEAISNSSAGKAVARTYEAAKNSEAGKAVARTYEAAKNSEAGKAVARTYEAAKDWVLGATSKKYESGKGGAATISSGKGDLGGKSYGTYQMTGGALNNFVTKGKYSKEFEGLAPKSAEFDAKWKELAAKDPEFGKAQHDFIKQSHFDPQHAKLQKEGIDLSKRGAAVQDAIWSSSVQFGGNTDLIKKALAGKDHSKMSDEEVVSAIQDYKIANNDTLFKSSSADVRAGTLARAQKEKADLVAMTKNPELQKVGENSTQVAQAKPAAGTPAATQVAQATPAPATKPAATQVAQATPAAAAMPTDGQLAAASKLTGKSKEDLAFQSIMAISRGKIQRATEVAAAPAAQTSSALTPSSGTEKLASASQTNVGEIVGEQTMETKKAEQQAAQPIVVAGGGGAQAPAPQPQGGTTNTGSAPMVTRNQDSSIRRVTDGMMSYGMA